VDDHSTNGLYCQGRRVKSVLLPHGRSVTLGPTKDPQSVQLQVVAPPPFAVYLARGVWLGLGVTLCVGFFFIGQEWRKIVVDPLPAGTRGPLVVLAGDQRTELRRTPSDTYRALESLEDFGPTLPKVVVAAEDHRFYSHFGLDLIGISRALFVNVTSGQLQQGGSSISQQLARTILRDYTGTDNSLGRKLREALAALKLESRYSKSELLVLYLNNVYLGNGIYGFESGAQFYFGVPAQDLDLSQAAAMASILPAPNVFNPVDNYDAAVRGRARVLARLEELGVFQEEEIRRAQRSRLLINPEIDLSSTVAPYFYNTVLQELQALLGQDLASEGGFVVETTLQPRMQIIAEKTLSETVATQGASYGFSQAALVTVDAQTGEILTLVGGVDYQDSQFNRVVQAQRQPGSTFKIFPYTTALELGISPTRTYPCSAFSWGGQTFTGCRSGSAALTLEQGLILSENVIALRLAQEVGMDRVIQTARRMGIRSPLQPYPATVLGTMEVNLLELTESFAVLANQGVHARSHTIRRILDSSDCVNPQDWRTCRRIYPESGENPAQPQLVLSPGVASVMTRMLQGVMVSGTGRSGHIGWGEAGKTGTTTANKDLLFVGYLQQPAWVTGVWLGNDDSSPTRGSSSLAAQVWATAMRQFGS
jgi:membrane peptidoglycan carboxypeptidase